MLSIMISHCKMFANKKFLTVASNSRDMANVAVLIITEWLMFNVRMSLNLGMYFNCSVGCREAVEG